MREPARTPETQVAAPVATPAGPMLLEGQVDAVLSLQRTAGNRATIRAIGRKPDERTAEIERHADEVTTGVQSQDAAAIEAAFGGPGAPRYQAAARRRRPPAPDGGARTRGQPPPTGRLRRVPSQPDPERHRRCQRPRRRRRRRRRATPRERARRRRRVRAREAGHLGRRPRGQHLRRLRHAHQDLLHDQGREVAALVRLAGQQPRQLGRTRRHGPRRGHEVGQAHVRDLSRRWPPAGRRCGRRSRPRTR